MLNLLIIDDEPWSRQVVKALGDWETHGLQVVGEAQDGREGIEMIEQLQPQLVLTDMRMPGLDGVELLKELNERFPALKIIVMSGYDDFVYLQQAIRSRAVEYLLKPIDPDELNRALAQCVQELEKAHQLMNSSWSTPHLFANKADLDTYLSFREKIYENLLELNGSAVLLTFDRLGEYLQSTFKDKQDDKVLIKIGSDLIVMLEEFASGNEVDFDLSRLERNREKPFKAGLHSISDEVTHLATYFGETIEAIQANRRNRNRLDLAAVQTHINRHFQEPISLETIAQYFYVSKEHLSRTYKASFGENISDTIIRKKMEKARELIVEHKLAIKHIAELTGYTDLAYFYKVFKKHYGLTPGELRKEE
ncbi:response regulator [Paenibacillus sp. GP183]|jgi:two-component system response regulator YesN|uniref:response regulator n=1 Tax=Paenibacillus sp. GP183 TaxID=1882751 RepID=UPI00089491FE|nr:response regulator [Paenibacillus sp. GP183]SEC42359.1 two-component system, response regulator YesN [Paenibacillus sp. GP183]